ncbi:hypothetical protein TNCV_298011 [Trichonephila clavipes]|nr:hypothetical protein TNCV_298011 [Trichonephila clavipes]
MEGVASIQRRYPLSVNKKQITALFSFLEQINIGDALLNGLLHSNDYKGRWVACRIEVLPTITHLALDIKAVSKPWEKKLQKPLYFLTFSRA